RRLCQLGVDRKSNDNVSVLIVWFSFGPSFSPSSRLSRCIYHNKPSKGIFSSNPRPSVTNSKSLPMARDPTAGPTDDESTDSQGSAESIPRRTNVIRPTLPDQPKKTHPSQDGSKLLPRPSKAEALVPSTSDVAASPDTETPLLTAAATSQSKSRRRSSKSPSKKSSSKSSSRSPSRRKKSSEKPLESSNN
ncbi:MAG: hypothetical protein Q8P67_17085, partial [archaeon]|nr:hypothetical protein [archaeon]